MNAAEIKSQLEAAQAREKQLAADLIPARKEWAQTRTDHTYGRCDAVRVAIKREKVLTLERQHIEVAASTHQLTTIYRDIARLESGELHADLRAQMRECF